MHLLEMPATRHQQPESVNSNVKSLLKILSGPNIGATVSLPNGAFYVGNNVECDIVLHDEFVAHQHIRILQVNRRLCVEVIAQPVWINGQKKVTGNVALNYHDIVTVGQTSFCLGKPNERWPELELPAIGEIEKPTAAEVVISERLPIPEKPQVVAQVGQGSAVNTRVNRHWWRRWHLGLTIPVILVSSALLFAARGPVAEKPLTKHAEMMAVQDVITSLGADENVQVSQMRNGEISISGYAQDYLEKQVMVERISRLSPSTSVRIYDTEKMVLQSTQMLSLNRLHQVTASSTGPGVLLLQGYESDDFRLRNTLQHIRSETAGLRELKNEVITPNSAFRYLLSLVKDTDIEPYLLLNLREDRIWAEGTLSDEMLNDWLLVMKKFRSVYEILPELVERVDNKALKLN